MYQNLIYNQFTLYSKIYILFMLFPSFLNNWFVLICRETLTHYSPPSSQTLPPPINIPPHLRILMGTPAGQYQYALGSTGLFLEPVCSGQYRYCPQHTSPKNKPVLPRCFIFQTDIFTCPVGIFFSGDAKYQYSSCSRNNQDNLAMSTSHTHFVMRKTSQYSHQ